MIHVLRFYQFFPAQNFKLLYFFFQIVECISYTRILNLFLLSLTHGLTHSFPSSVLFHLFLSYSNNLSPKILPIIVSDPDSDFAFWKNSIYLSLWFVSDLESLTLLICIFYILNPILVYYLCFSTDLKSEKGMPLPATVNYNFFVFFSWFVVIYSNKGKQF